MFCVVCHRGGHSILQLHDLRLVRHIRTDCGSGRKLKMVHRHQLERVFSANERPNCDDHFVFVSVAVHSDAISCVESCFNGRGWTGGAVAAIQADAKARFRCNRSMVEAA